MAGILVVGNYCHDTVHLADGTCSEALGGSASYISSVFRSLDLAHDLVAKVGSDFEYFQEVLHPPQIIQGIPTTHYLADFTQGERQIRLKSQCEPIFPENLPSPERPYPLALVVGVAGEVLPETFDRLIQISNLRLCDLQGLIRAFDRHGHVNLMKLDQTPFISRLDQITVLKASQEEARYLDLEKVRAKTTLVVTEGRQGCTIFFKDSEIHIPAFVTEEVDPTGAGDCFMAGLAAGMMRGLPLEKAALLGNSFGAFAVGQIGVPRTLSQEMCERLVFVD